MINMPTKETRVDESRKMLVNASYFAIGAYTEQEAKKLDQWRDENWWQLCNHIAHEVEEIRRSINDSTKLIHNLNDLVGLSLIMLAKGMIETGLMKDE